MEIKTDLFSELIGGNYYWRLSKTLVRTIGIEETLFLTSLLYKYISCKDKGLIANEEFYYKQPLIEEDTTLPPDKQVRITKVLERINLITTKKAGAPPKIYFKINFPLLGKIMSYPDVDIEILNILPKVRATIIKEEQKKKKESKDRRMYQQENVPTQFRTNQEIDFSKTRTLHHNLNNNTTDSLISKDISTKVPTKELNLEESNLEFATNKLEKLNMTNTNKLNLKESNSADKLDINNNQSELNTVSNQSVLNLANSEPKGSLHDSTESCTNESFHIDNLIGTTNQPESSKAMFIGANDKQPKLNKNIDSLIGTASQPSQASIVLKKRQVNQCLLEQSACSNQLDINISTIAPAPAPIKIGFQPPQLSQVRQKLKENPNTFKENGYQGIKVMKTPSYIQEIIDLWNEKGGKKLNEFQSNAQTQTYQDTVSCLKKLLNGTMYNKIDSYNDYSDFKFTMEQIKSTILRFSLAAKNPDYEPKSQKTKNLLCKRSLKDFIFSGFSRSVNSDKEGFINFRSLFLFYFENKPVKIKSRFETQLLEDKYPATTDALIRFYYRKAQKNDVSIAEENYFINASVKLKNFYDKNKKELILFEIGTHTKFLSLLDLFKECISEFYERKGKLLPNYFNSYYTFEYTFKRFLLEKGVFESEMLPIAEEEFYDED